MDNSSEDNQRYDELERLLAASAPRPRASDEVESAVRSAVQSEWENMIAERRYRHMAAFGIAASLLIFVLATGLFSSRAAQAPTVGQWERVAGAVSVETADGHSAPAKPGSVVAAGTRLISATNAGGAILWSGQMSLRINEDTSLRVLSDGHIELEHGELYIDTRAADESQSGPPLTIEVAGFEIQHVGTQYMVGYRNRSVTAVVRSGSIEVTGSGPRQWAPKGQSLTRRGSDDWAQQSVATFGNAWSWAEELSPRLHVQGQPLGVILAWAAKETGREVYYASKEARVLAESKTLESDTQLEVVTALQVVTRTSDLRALIDGARIIVDLKQRAVSPKPQAVP